MCDDRDGIYHNPRENIGYRNGHTGSMPLEDILYKMEETDLGGEDYGEILDDQVLETDKYMRDIMVDRTRTEPLMNADEEPTRNYVENSGVLNSRFNMHRGKGDPNPHHEEMFQGFMDVNPNGADYEAPRFDTEAARAHTVIRARNTKMDLQDSNVGQTAQTDWQPAQISFAKKDMLRWVQNIYNTWHLPSFVNFTNGHTAANPIAESANKKQIMNEYKQHLDETGPDVMDQYGRILSNNTGYSWYTLPYMEHTMPFHLESTVQPKAIISTNDPASMGLYYADAEFNSEETTSRIPPTQVRFPEHFYSKVNDGTTHNQGDGLTSVGKKHPLPPRDTTKVKRYSEGTAEATESMMTRGQKGKQPQSDFVKHNFKGTSKLDDPLFGGALAYSSDKRSVDIRNILNKTEDTTVSGRENQQGNDRKMPNKKTNPDKKFGFQEETQAKSDNEVQKNFKGQSLRVRQDNFKNKEFGELNDEVLSRVEGRGRGHMSTPVSKKGGAEHTMEMADSTDPIMRAKNNNDSWAHRGKMKSGIDNNDVFEGADNREHVMGTSGRSFDPYAKARNHNKHDVSGLEERF